MKFELSMNLLGVLDGVPFGDYRYWDGIREVVRKMKESGIGWCRFFLPYYRPGVTPDWKKGYYIDLKYPGPYFTSNVFRILLLNLKGNGIKPIIDLTGYTRLTWEKEFNQYIPEIMKQLLESLDDIGITEFMIQPANEPVKDGMMDIIKPCVAALKEKFGEKWVDYVIFNVDDGVDPVRKEIVRPGTLEPITNWLQTIDMKSPWPVMFAVHEVSCWADITADLGTIDGRPNVTQQRIWRGDYANICLDADGLGMNEKERAMGLHGSALYAGIMSVLRGCRDARTKKSRVIFALHPRGDSVNPLYFSPSGSMKGNDVEMKIETLLTQWADTNYFDIARQVYFEIFGKYPEKIKEPEPEPTPTPEPEPEKEDQVKAVNDLKTWFDGLAWYQKAVVCAAGGWVVFATLYALIGIIF